MHGAGDPQFSGLDQGGDDVALAGQEGSGAAKIFFRYRLDECGIAGAAIAFVATFTVTTLVDDINGSGQDTGLSLREAIDLANASSGFDRIVFSQSLADGVVKLQHGELIITDTVEIDAGSLGFAIDANSQSRVIDITSAAQSVSLAGLTVTGGHVEVYDEYGASPRAVKFLPLPTSTWRNAVLSATISHQTAHRAVKAYLAPKRCI